MYYMTGILLRRNNIEEVVRLKSDIGDEYGRDIETGLSKYGYIYGNCEDR